MQQRLEFLLERYMNRTATEAELGEFFEIIQGKKYRSELEAALLEKWMQHPGDDKVLFAGRDEQEVLSAILDKEKQPAAPVVHRIPLLHTAWIRYAAAVILLIIGSVYFLNRKTNVATKEMAQQEPVKDDVAPGGNKAILTLADGTTVVLDDADNGTLAQQGNSHIIKKGGELIYMPPGTPGGGSEAFSTYNTMATPRGGQYKLRLPDGTKVWLNAASSITYPVRFNDKERSVTITGEAYFDVVKDAKRKFLVNANGITTEVLGTAFNVNSYTEEENVHVALLEGAVKVSRTALQTDIHSGTDSKLLKPGQQAGLNKRTGKLSVGSADVEAIAAWKNGLFQFNADDIETIMRELGRWYDIEIDYVDKIPDGHYSGIVSRASDLSKVLKILEESDLHFKIEGKKLIVL